MRFAIGMLTGALLAGVAVFLYASKQAEQTLTIFEGATSARASDRAIEAYQNEDPMIAIWELRHLADVQAEELRAGRTDTNAAAAALLMTRARLAKIYQEQGRTAEAQTNAQLALKLLGGLPVPSRKITNMETLLENVRKTDLLMQKQPKYE